MRRPILRLVPVLLACAAGAVLLLRHRDPVATPPGSSKGAPDPRPAETTSVPAAAVEPVAAPPSTNPAEAPAPLWQSQPDRARRRWAKGLVEHPPTLTRDEFQAELGRIERLPDGDERIDAVRALFGSDQIDRAATDRLLALYDRSAPGDFRKVLFGALLFSSAGDYVAEQMLFRSRSQAPDDREYTYFAALTSRHAEAWDFLCESLPACQGEDAACRAALAVAGMAADYGGAPVQRLQSLLSQTTWPAARVYLFQALLSTPGAEGLDGARKALLQERDEDVRRAVFKMRPGLAK